MNEFTASNGRKFVLTQGGALRTGSDPFSLPMASLEMTQALRELFQAEADERLGRWRWPENPDYIVIDLGRDSDGYRYAEAMHEPTRVKGRWQEGQRSDSPQTRPDRLGIDAVAAYFGAHPEPKPWHNAKPGEVWALTGAGGLEQPWRRIGERWVSFSGEIEYDAVRAIAGRRIWPEVAS